MSSERQREDIPREEVERQRKEKKERQRAEKEAATLKRQETLEKKAAKDAGGADQSQPSKPSQPSQSVPPPSQPSESQSNDQRQREDIPRDEVEKQRKEKKDRQRAEKEAAALKKAAKDAEGTGQESQPSKQQGKASQVPAPSAPIGIQRPGSLAKPAPQFAAGASPPRRTPPQSPAFGSKVPPSPSQGPVQGNRRTRGDVSMALDDLAPLDSGTHHSHQGHGGGGGGGGHVRRPTQQEGGLGDRTLGGRGQDRGAIQFDDPKQYAKHAKKQMLQRTPVQKQVPLFSHLPQYERESSLSLQVGFSSEELHPAIIRLGLQYADGSIIGSNARCVALLCAMKAWITDYKTHPEKVFSLDLHSKMKPLIRFLIDCRPQSISMGNALRYLKSKIAALKPNVPEQQAKQYLCAKIDSFIQERIEFAGHVIAKLAVSKINDGDVILTYAKSHVVEMIIKKAFDEKKNFRVILVDSRPKFEGRVLLKKLVSHGVKCTYIMINAVSYVMQEVTKVFLGAYGMMANGAAVSRVGSAVVAMVAQAHNVPLIFCCETYKFHKRCKLDAICFNELGDPDDLVSSRRDDSQGPEALTEWRDMPKLKLLNLVYDLTPAEFVTMVITEVGMIPATSVPVILREYHKDQYLE